jgi:hypothetical protein
VVKLSERRRGARLKRRREGEGARKECEEEKKRRGFRQNVEAVDERSLERCRVVRSKRADSKERRKAKAVVVFIVLGPSSSPACCDGGTCLKTACRHF